jgi:CheY-like chemotaxis protein
MGNYMGRQYKVLAADMPQGIQTLRNILGDSVELVTAASLPMAEAILADQQVNAIICGIHFDDSRMFDLLAFAKAHPSTKAIPFLIFRDIESKLDRTFARSIQISAEIQGAVGFIDLYHLKEKHGTEFADIHLRKIIFAMLENDHAT